VEKLNKIPSVAGNKCFSITAPLPRELWSLNSAKGGFSALKRIAIDYKDCTKLHQPLPSTEIHAT